MRISDRGAENFPSETRVSEQVGLIQRGLFILKGGDAFLDLRWFSSQSQTCIKRTCSKQSHSIKRSLVLKVPKTHFLYLL